MELGSLRLEEFGAVEFGSWVEATETDKMAEDPSLVVPLEIGNPDVEINDVDEMAEMLKSRKLRIMLSNPVRSPLWITVYGGPEPSQSRTGYNSAPTLGSRTMEDAVPSKPGGALTQDPNASEVSKEPPVAPTPS